MSSGLLDDDVLSPEDAEQVGSLETVRAALVADARSWAVQLEQLSALAARAERTGAQTRRTLALELAGSWQVSQLTAENWVAQAERFHEALPLTLSMLQDGTLLRHQAVVLLHRTQGSTPEVAAAVEAEVLPAGAGLCPSDLGRKVDRVRLRIEAEQADPAERERQEAQKVAERRTWVRATPEGMAVAGALLTPEQGVSWAAGMDALERRERLADRAAGIDRTAEQRRTDLFAALPALVLAATAQDDRWRREAGLPAGGRISSPAPQDGPVPALFEEEPPGGRVPPPWAFTPEQVAAHVTLNVHVPVSTVLELSQEPGSLDKHGPVSAEHIRLLRPKSFRRVMVDAQSGQPIAVDDKPTPAADTREGRREQLQQMLRPDVIVDADEPQHDPSARLARLIDLRDVRCAGPGCSSSRCDRDHLQPHPLGATSARNLGLLSRRCHSAKHHGWTLTRHPDSSVTWTSPLHRRYDRPGPWTPPPKIDLHAEPPPPRAAPAPPPPPPDDQEDDGQPLMDRLGAAAPPPKPLAPPSHRGWNDDPPF
jgi:hypothetical protein